MTFRCLFRTVIAASAVSVVLALGGFAQNSAPAMQNVHPSEAQAFKITPVRPIAELRVEALKAKPPEEPGPFLYPMLTEVTEQNSKFIHLDIRYATTNNFLGEPVYEQPRAFLQAHVAQALRAASWEVQKKGYGLLVYDAYRPWVVTKIFWEATPVEKREFVGNPAQGSRHNRGCAVDLSLYDLKSGSAVEMPSEYDEMTPRAYADYSGATFAQKEHREILRKAMEKAGFVQRPNEWWHYDYKDWQKYELLNIPLDKVPNAPYRIGRGVSPPRVLTSVPPKYTEEAKNNQVYGAVVLSVVVSADGMPTDIRVKRSLDRRLDEEAIKALLKWRFKPGKFQGKNVPVLINVEVSFRLTD